MTKTVIFTLILAAAVAVGAWYFTNSEAAAVSPFRFVDVEIGDVESVVSSTGTLSPVTTVEVGTQVSGRVEQIFVDFNDRVRRGQLIATIDTTMLVAAIRDSELNLERARAQLAQSEREYNRIKELHEKQFVSDVEYNRVAYDYETARTAYRSAELNLERAIMNLDYAWIRAPIDGTVVERNVDIGQTVAASMSAPTLFLIANDLTQMQILASVDESDIGSIKDGQTARFTVQAYPDEVFSGTVRQVRLQPRTESNVVMYSVVIDVINDSGLLLPGMTATVDFLLERASGVFKVPNAALRFRPTPAMLAAVQENAETRPGGEVRTGLGDGAEADSLRREFRARVGEGAAGGGAAARTQGAGGAGMFMAGAGEAGMARGRATAASNVATLWMLDDQGRLATRRVQTGITDGQATEIRGEGLEAGMRIIAGVVSTAAGSTTNAPASPFQQEQSPDRRFLGRF